jgi:hypothetical protein
MNRDGHGCTRSYPDLRYYTGICQKAGAEIKLPLPLSLIKHPVNKHTRSEGTRPRSVISFTFRPLHTRQESTAITEWGKGWATQSAWTI